MSESNITPLEDNSPRLNDYKRYKGRGRYARVSTCEDPDTNRPVSREDENHEPNYDRYETVRNKEQRKQLLGDDCECCRDYYAGVGPLPPRLQQPMWRSPSPNSIPTTKPLCKHRQTDTYATNVGASGSMEQVQEEEITRHKQAISRHRHHWYRPKTPPGYWDIGFPDTQEASDINRRARDMIRQKMHGISRDAG
ncbi:hypothetical protein SERLA73DRAFT_115178 [Serpula lacrymans var. lacrymans S7.3]|uniref:DNA endonuclease activator Ctp1 C-terminal domain-containing protein n=2 Tax=Serpula lacrymans var. lacrymans TaxID=341189 RepID=F8QCA3_SERL3|nr:uncharacterized protein SERLADRAFT_479448 [Serpula lacrymans var. lacrymans S7.9]EGN94222.1 hypothetical protein SERLA73DRAFT_115178 [Serpula lacrymans var. lacrymans S7.3]EGO19712.1 hypothetical protein SERLADRAFT_479448 [Serpula lacrymans var. lacrymans S7.9]